MKRVAPTLALLLAACTGAQAELDPLGSPASDSGSDAAVAVPPGFDVEGGWLRDGAGRAVVLRGVNVAHTAKRSSDGLPWIDRDAVLRLRREWGLNVVRLTLFWRFVEPARGAYDRAYLARIREILDWAEQAQVVVLVDLHQDLFGHQATDAGEGDGPPEWARDASCPAFEDVTPWFQNYFTPAVECQFASFWADHDGVQTAFAETWKVVADEVAPHPAVVGFDLWNEPWIPSATTPDAVLGPFYQRLVSAVRERAPEVPVFYEPGTLTGSLTDQGIEKPDFPRLVYAPHYYPPEIFLGAAYVSDPAKITPLYQRHANAAKAAGVPLFIGEFGSGATVPGVEQLYVDLNDLWRADFVGFARWSYDSVADYDLAILDASGAELPSLRSMVEPYAERVPGTPRGTDLDRAARTLQLRLDAPEGGELVVSCPKRLCGERHDVGVTQGKGAAQELAAVYDAELGRLTASLPKGQQLVVTVSY